MLRKFVSLSLSILLVAPAFGWGRIGHQLTNEGAVRLLRATTYGPWLERNLYLLKRYAITPDDDWKAGPGHAPTDPQARAKREEIDKFEHPNHFAQADAFVPPSHYLGSEGRIDVQNLVNLPAQTDFRQAYPELARLLAENSETVSRLESPPLQNPHSPTAHDVVRQGTLPWRVVQLYDLAVQALKVGHLDLAALYLGTMGHYVGDCSQPFHNTMRFNPGGIHSKYESTILELQARMLGYHEDSNFVWKMDRLVAKVESRFPAERSLTSLSRGEIISGVREVSASGFAYIDPLITVFEAAKKQYPFTPSRSRDHGRPSAGHSHSSDETSTAALRAFSKAIIESRVNGIAPESVIDTTYMRIAKSSELLARLWVSAFEAAGVTASQLKDIRPWDTSRKFPILNFPKLETGE